MIVEYIAEIDAPSDVTISNAKRETVAIVLSLATGIVAKVTPDNTVRGLKIALKRAANELGVAIKLWDSDGIVYALRLPDVTPVTPNADDWATFDGYYDNAEDDAPDTK